MRKTFLLVVFVLLSLLILSACQIEDADEIPGKGMAAEISSAAATQSAFYDQQDIIEELVKTNTPTVTPTPVEDDEDSLDDIDFDCTETFCSWSWPGWIERPIGLGNTRTIDISYPYASTGEGAFEIHHGVEFLNPNSTPVLAAQDGEVIFADYDATPDIGPYWGFYGYVVILRHPDLVIDEQVVYTLYAHLSGISVAVGDQVTTGDVLGEVGFSGVAVGPHLHFEVRVGINNYDHTVNPILWFAPLDETDHPSSAMLAGQILGPSGFPVTELPLTLEHLTADGTVQAIHYPKTYYAGRVNAHPLLEENFAVSDLPAGDYRLTFVYVRLYEIHFTLEPGALGFIRIQLD